MKRVKAVQNYVLNVLRYSYYEVYFVYYICL